MASISDITQAASYRGDPNLGGEGAVGVTLDSSPLQRMANFTFYRDRDMWEKKNKDDALAADMIAKVTALDINSPLKAYTDDLMKQKDNIENFLLKRPTATNFSKDPEGFRELSRLYGEFNTKRQRATANDVLYNKDKADVEKMQPVPAKDAAAARLELKTEELFEQGIERAYGKQFMASGEVKAGDYTVPKIPTTQLFDITDRGGNAIVVNGRKFADIGRLRSLTSGVYQGLFKTEITENDPSLAHLSPKQRKIRASEINSGNQKLIGLQNTSVTINKLVDELKVKYGVPLSQIPDSEIAKIGGSLGNYIQSMKKMNAEIADVNQKTGNTFQGIDMDNGISPEDLIEVETFNANGGTLYEELKPDVTLTDEDIKYKKIEADKEISKAGIDWERDKYTLGLHGSDETKTAAIAFSEKLLTDLMGISSFPSADGGRILTADDMRAIPADHIKWLGQEKEPVLDKTTGKVRPGISPIALGKNDVLHITKDGKVMVLKNAKQHKDKKTGQIKWTGQWDNTRSTTVQNITRMVLNEENERAGGKEINNYTPLDLGVRKPEVYTTQSGGSRTATGSSSAGGTGGTYTVTNPTTGAVVGTGVDQQAAEAMRLKGYTITKQ